MREKWPGVAPSRGALGERATAAALARLPAGEWAVFHDVRWPGRSNRTIDHVVVGPPGVFVIDSLNWSGRIDLIASVVRHDGRHRQEVVTGVARAARAVGSLAGMARPHEVQPVLCFVRNEDLVGRAGKALVGTTGNIVRLLTTRVPLLDADARTLLCLELDAVLHSAVELPVDRPASAPVASLALPVRRRRRPRRGFRGRTQR